MPCKRKVEVSGSCKFPPHDDYGHFYFAEIRTFELCSNIPCKRKVEVSGSCKFSPHDDYGHFYFAEIRTFELCSNIPSPRPNRSFSCLPASFSLVHLQPAPDWFATMALRSSAPSGFYAHRSNRVRRLPSLRAGAAALAAWTSTKDLFHLALDAAEA